MKCSRIILSTLLILVCGWAVLPAESGTRTSGQSKGGVNPYSGDTDAALAGKKLYLRNCSHCHGEEGEGRMRAVSLRSAAVRNSEPGALFRVIKNGNLRRGMPSWAHMPDQRIWQIVTYIQAIGTID